MLLRMPLSARAAAVVVGVLLMLFAQLLAVSHLHAEEGGHGDRQDGPACSLCVYKAAGHEQLGPLPSNATLRSPSPPCSVAPAEGQPCGKPQGRHFGKQARGPPLALLSA
jgi:hypothetical protein